MINDDGQEYYAVSSEFNLKAAQENRWVRENVLDKLPPEDTWISLRDMKPQIFDFVGKKPTKFNYYCIEEDSSGFIYKNLFISAEWKDVFYDKNFDGDVDKISYINTGLKLKF